MEFSHRRRISARREDVWNAVRDPRMLAAAIPGCKELTGTVERGFKARTVRWVGPIKMTFHADIRFSNSIAPERFTISGIGRGGLVGYATGQADVILTEVASDVTELEYSAQVRLPVKLGAGLTRQIVRFTINLVEGFFDRIARRLESYARVSARMH